MSDNEKLATIRHSMAHVMAEAVLDLFPGTKIAIGPSIENGFYYDFDLPKPIADSDLEAISARMKEIIASGVPFERREVTREEAKAMSTAPDRSRASTLALRPLTIFSRMPGCWRWKASWYLVRKKLVTVSLAPMTRVPSSSC